MARFFGSLCISKRGGGLCLGVGLLAFAVLPTSAQTFDHGIAYTNIQIAKAPWSIHLVKVDRTQQSLALCSVHAGGIALGLSTLSDQTHWAGEHLGQPLAAINGDFYQRDKAPYAGDPRGLQVLNGELISRPDESASFWIDALGQPQAGHVGSLFEVTWPNGTRTAIGLNENTWTTNTVLYTPAVGVATRATNVLELVLEALPGSRRLPLRVGQQYSTRVREINQLGNSALSPDTMVLALGASARACAAGLQTGAILRISTATSPPLHGIQNAIGGGPVLIRNGKVQKIERAKIDSYQYTSMFERHPRTAIGWNDSTFFLVEVDGRQKELSVGMTLDELAKFLVDQGCSEAMNLDGGGSATLWFEGSVRNSPCDGYERAVANSLVVVRKGAKAAPASGK